MKVFANDDLIGNAEFENPYGMGKMTEEELEVYKQKEALNRAKVTKNLKDERAALRRLIWKYHEVKNYRGLIESAEEYIKRFDDQDDSVWNMLYIGNSNLGRAEAAKRALERAMGLEPNAAYLNYNYSNILERNNPKEALDHLDNLSENLKNDVEIRCRIISLKNDLGENIKTEALKVVLEHKNNPSHFTEFAKKNLLPKIYRIADEPYAFVDPKTKRKAEDQKHYLDTNNLPL